MTTTRDVTKQPKWVQLRLSVLESSVNYWKEKARGASEDDTEVFIRNFPDDDTGLPPQSELSFIIENDGTEQGRFDVRVKDGRLQITGVGRRMSDQLRVSPRSTNIVYVDLTPWPDA